MGMKSIKGALIAVSLLGSTAVWADGRSFDSYEHHSGEFRNHRDGGEWKGSDGNGGWGWGNGGGGWGNGGGWGHVPSAPEPSEWVFMGIGLGLIGAVAYRRQARKQD